MLRLSWIAAVAVLAALAVDSSVQSRDPLLSPFCTESIWNVPIGSNATYVAAQIQPFHNLGPDISHFVAAVATDPLVQW